MAGQACARDRPFRMMDAIEHDQLVKQATEVFRRRLFPQRYGLCSRRSKDIAARAESPICRSASAIRTKVAGAGFTCMVSTLTSG